MFVLSRFRKSGVYRQLCAQRTALGYGQYAGRPNGGSVIPVAAEEKTSGREVRAFSFDAKSVTRTLRLVGRRRGYAAPIVSAVPLTSVLASGRLITLTGSINCREPRVNAVDWSCGDGNTGCQSPSSKPFGTSKADDAPDAASRLISATPTHRSMLTTTTPAALSGRRKDAVCAASVYEGCCAARAIPPSGWSKTIPLSFYDWLSTSGGATGKLEAGERYEYP